MREHSLKIWPEPFEAIIDGRKRFEFRQDDRGFAVGDTLRLSEWDPSPLGSRAYPPCGYTGRRLTVRVTYLARGQWGIPDGYVVMSIARPEER